MGVSSGNGGVHQVGFALWSNQVVFHCGSAAVDFFILVLDGIPSTSSLSGR